MLYLIVFVLLRLCIEITLCNVFIFERESLKHVFVGITNMMPRYHGLHMSSSHMKAATGQVEIGMEVFLCVEEERLYNAAFLHGPMAIRLWYKRITPAFAHTLWGCVHKIADTRHTVSNRESLYFEGKTLYFDGATIRAITLYNNILTPVLDKNDEAEFTFISMRRC
ncbi:hypothetical protein MRX96_044295 [Rhipicephalus microplus]